ERHRNAHQLLAAGDEERDLVAGPVLLETVFQSIGAHAEVVDGENLVVDVEAGDVRRRIALHLRDDEAAVVVAGRDAGPRPATAVGRRGAGRLEPQAV